MPPEGYVTIEAKPGGPTYDFYKEESKPYNPRAYGVGEGREDGAGGSGSDGDSDSGSGPQESEGEKSEGEMPEQSEPEDGGGDGEGDQEDDDKCGDDCPFCPSEDEDDEDSEGGESESESKAESDEDNYNLWEEKPVRLRIGGIMDKHTGLATHVRYDVWEPFDQTWREYARLTWSEYVALRPDKRIELYGI